MERVESNEQPPLLLLPPPPPPPPASSPAPASESPVDTSKGEKRPLDEPFDEEDTPVMERINKRVKLAEKENDERVNVLHTEQSQKKRTIKLKSTNNHKNRTIPSTRISRQSKATWVRKYGIEECCIRMNQYDPIYDNGTE